MNGLNRTIAVLRLGSNITCLALALAQTYWSLRTGAFAKGSQLTIKEMLGQLSLSSCHSSTSSHSLLSYRKVIRRLDSSMWRVEQRRRWLIKSLKINFKSDFAWNLIKSLNFTSQHYKTQGVISSTSTTLRWLSRKIWSLPWRDAEAFPNLLWIHMLKRLNSATSLNR